MIIYTHALLYLYVHEPAVITYHASTKVASEVLGNARTVRSFGKEVCALLSHPVILSLSLSLSLSYTHTHTHTHNRTVSVCPCLACPIYGCSVVTIGVLIFILKILCLRFSF